MDQKKLTFKSYLALFTLCICCLYASNAQEAVPFTPRLTGGNIEIRGDVLYVGNNILNRASESDPGQANTPYNGTQNNNSLWMEYIDIDGDPSTFSSSSAELNITDPNCSLVRYAGLYWAATYPNERSTDGSASFTGTPRIEDWFNVKFKIPGGSYVDLTADTAVDPIGEEDDIIFDGYDYNNINNSFKDSPYICYKNVTNLVLSNTDPSGEYTVANMRATKGKRNGSSSAGWVMVVIYENPNETGKFISTFDGYAGMSGSVGTVNVDVNGFKTLPTGFPVNARIGVGALEGDRSITNDRFKIKANMNATFTDLSTTSLNPANNFFNSTISINDAQVPGRTPYGTNTLGLDLDIFDLSNPNNVVLPNDETGATLQFTSTGDGYGSFLATFLVEQIEPNIVLEKRVEDIGGNDITGLGVNLGQTLDYVLSFQNLGNDDAVNYTIRDVLPINVTLDEANLVLPSGVTYTFDEPTRTVLFTIPDNLVNQEDPIYSIRMRVKVAENCFDFIDACSDLIQNLAFSTYSGDINTNVITDDPSVSDFDNCGFVVPGATNFLLDDLSDCNFERTVELCGADVLLDAGDNFDDYVWKRDDNNNGIFDASDTTMTDGDPDNDPSTLLVDAVGTYIVDKIVADPCKGFKEIIHVVPYGTGTIPNPIIEYYNAVNGDADPSNDLAGEIVQCSIDNALLPKLFLCGINDIRLLQVNIVDSQSIVWEKLDETSCAPAGDDCANKNLTCTWNQVGTGNNYSLDSPGKYRLFVNYQNGCSNRFYFNAFQNTLDIQYNKHDIICTTPGNITITNLGNGYGYQLVDATSGSVIVPFSANNGPVFSFNTGENGGYRVEVVQLDNSGVPIVGACIFSTSDIGILERSVTYDVDATDATCSSLGSINIQINNADPNYEYEIRLDDGSNGGLGTLVDNETAQPDNNFTFTDLNPGNYIAIARTDDGCFYSEQVTIIDNDNLDLTANVAQPILCGNGIIEMQPSGGEAPYAYALWTFVNEGGSTVVSYPSVQDIPGSAYQTNTDFNVAVPGDYTFVVVDKNNCFHFSNTVTITEPILEYTTSLADENCFGQADGSFTVNVTNSNGYSLSYQLTYPDNSTEVNISGAFTNLPQGDYTLDILQSSGTISCTIQEIFTIGGPSDSVSGLAVMVQDYTCAQEGIIEAQNTTGGTAPYAYSIDGVNFVGPAVGAETFTNLTNGTYTITIRDANGCTFVTNPVTLDPLNEPSDLTFTSTVPNCPAQTSDVTVTVVDGNTPFVFDIVAPSAIAATSISGNTADFNGLAPDTYTFRVTDDKGCSYTEDFTITPVIQIAVSGQMDNNISCFNLTDGAATFNVNSFNTSYDYSVTGPSTFSGTGETANIIPLTGLAAGTYTITVTDTDTNCTATADVAIAAPPAQLTISGLNIIDLTCSSLGTVPGSVTITAADGWGGYEYELEDPVGGIVGPQSNNSFTGLTDTSGNYTVTVRDAGGCEATQTFSLTPTVAPVLDVTANSLCYDSSIGLTLTANVTSGGVAPFQYRLNGGAYQSSNVFTGLAPGSHTVGVIDSKNCTGTANIDVFPTLTASANLVKDLDCSVAPDAEISIGITGGNPTFAYEVFRNGTSFQASTAVPGIPFSYFTTSAGTYEFLITDSEGCTVTTNQVVVTANTPPAVVEVVTNPLCNTSADGIAELQISGGSPPYQIVFDGSAPSAQTTYPGLIAGTYNYTVTDAKGCALTDDVTLIAPSVLLPGTIDIVQDYRCDNTSATLQAINYSGGTPGYTFSLDGVNFQASDTFSTGITAGTYTITVRDSNGCAEETPAIVVDPLNPPTDLSFAQTTPVCPAVTADITVTVTDGTAPFVYEIIAPAISTTNNGNNNLFVGLAPGTYTFQVTDSKGCTLQESYTVADIPRVDVLSQLTRNVSCFGASDGEFTFTVSDFASTFSYTVENSATVVVQSQTGINLTTAIAVLGLTADTYMVTVTDDTTNCTATTVIAISNPPAALDFTFANTPVTCIENATLTVTATDGWGSYEYQLEDTVGPVVVYPYQGSNMFVDVPAGTYTMYVRDAGGCIVNKPITIDPVQAPTITLDAASDFCYDSTDQAALTIAIADGVAPYSYSINGGGLTTVVGNPFTISNLIPGTYDIQVTDAYGCVSNILSETIEPQLSASAVLTKALDCSVSPDAIIDVTINNGYTPYASYEVSTDGGTLWSAPVVIVGNNFTYTTPTDGTYDFRITDNQGCTVITQAIVVPITNPDITSLVQTADIMCNGDAGAAIQVNLDTTKGVAPFTISVVNTTTSTNYGTQTSGLPAGTYEVTVTDAKSCADMEVIVISEPNAITYDVTVVPITCNPASGTDPGSITVENLAGGTAGYTYYLTGNNGYSASRVEAAGADYTFTILEFGIYEIDVIDANGCSVKTTNIIASPPDDLDIDVSTATVSCALGGTAIVTVSSVVGSGNYEFGILDSYSIPYASTYSPPDLPGGDTSTFTGLTPGIAYTFVVHDLTTDCYYFETAAAPINSPSSLTSTLDVVSNVTCTGNADGSVSFTFDNYDGGATSVSYEIFQSQSNVSTGITGSSNVNPPAVGTGVSVTDLGPLAPDVYYILFTEVGGAFNGCTVGSADFTITESTNVLQVNVTLEKNDNCNVNAGQVSAVGQYGTAPYEYQIALATDPVPTVATWTGSPANVFNVEDGNYTVYIKDANNCIQSDNVTVLLDPSPEISAIINDQCTADEGSFTVDITLDVAGIAPYAIRIDGAAPQAAIGLNNVGDSMTVSNLTSGAHSFEILDANGCGETENLTIYPPLAVLVNITSDENCTPANSGEATVTASGGSGNYSYTQITPAGPTNATGVFSGLTHSVAYTFEVEDTTTNCTQPVSITLPAPAIPTFALEATNVGCFGGSDGTITVKLDPGNIDTPYLYSLDGGTTTQPSNVFNGLAQGTYNVTVISVKGCQDTKAIDVNEPSQLDIAASASAFSCNDIASTITVTINNDGFGNPSGTGPYVYSFDNGANFQPGNTYQVPFGSPNVTVVVRDANGCTDTEVVPIPVVQQVAAVVNQIQAIDCTNGQEIIEIVASSGSGTYTYTELPSGNIVADPTNIILTQPGTYIYEVLDTVTNCSITVAHTIAPYDLIDVTATIVTDATCSDSSDGVIEVTITGYTGTFDYQVLDNLGVNVIGASGSDNAVTDPYVFNVATTLPAGTYSVQITETAYPECMAASNKVTIDAPEPLAIQLLDNVNANCIEANAIVTVQATGGTAPYTYGASVSGAGVPATFPFDNTIELDPSVNLNWDIYVRDSNGCIIGAPLGVTISMDTTPDISLAIDDECADEGSFRITVSLDAINTGIAPYTMSINGGAFQSIAGFPYAYTDLTAGGYTIEIRDANDCGEVENITVEPELNVSAVVFTQPTCTANDGVVEFTVVGGSGAFIATLLQSDLTPTGIAPVGNQFTGVAFGDYIVRITDNTLGTPNCTAEAPISLEEPTPVTLLVTDKTDVSCAGASDGSITINLEPSSAGINDNPPYMFEITDGTSTYTQSTNMFTGLPAGVWDITVTSNRNCVATDQVTITEPIALDASITNVVPFACDMNNTQQVAIIEATITAGTGTAPYFYNVNGGAFQPTGGTVFTHTVNTAGNYDVIVRDANGCLFALPTQVIDPINTFTAIVGQTTAISCASPEEILITVTDDGDPTNTYTFELLPIGNPNGVQTGTPTNVTATYELTAVGSYTFRVTDTNTGCYIDTLPYEIAPYDLIDVVATATTPVTCFGDGNGALEINVAGYTGTYDYQVFDGANNPIGGIVSTDTSVNPRSIPGLSGGNYYVRVTETAAPFCFEDSNTVTIASPDMPLTAIVNPLANVTCANNQGEILVDPSGGFAPYDIVLTNTSTGQVYNADDVQSFIFIGLSAGNFTIDVTDNAGIAGCTYNDTEVLVQPTLIVANATPPNTTLTCFGDTNGTVTANIVSGGSGTYQYVLNYYDNSGTTIDFSSGPQSSDTFTGLGAGIYSIMVSDGWNCDAETNKVTITEPTEVFASLIRTDPLTCATGVEFELTATGGSGTYEYSIDNAVFLPMTSNPLVLPAIGSLGAGTYQYYVRDAINGCQAVVSNAITENPIEPLTLTVDQTAAFINCAGENTAIIYAEADGGLGNYQYELYSNSVTAANRIAGPQPIGEFTGLIAATYWVNVISEDCTAAPEQVVIDEPIPLAYTDEVVDVSCFGGENGSITVTLSGGSGGYQYSISPNLDKFDTVNSFTNLAPGDYIVIAQDQNGCFEYLEYTISEPAIIDVNAMVTPEICAGSEDGSIGLVITGGTAPYRTALNSNADTDFVQDRVDFTNLAAGNYLVFVRDAQDCETNITITVDPGVNLNAVVDPVYECTGNTPNNYVNITLEDSSVLGDLLYAIDSTDPNDMQLNPDFRDIPPGDHYITIAHTNGCTNTVDFTIEGYEPLTLSLEQRNLNEITAIAEGGRTDYTFYFDGVDNGTDNTYYIRRTDTYEVRVVDANGCEAIATIFMEFIDIEIPNFFTPDGNGKNDFWKPAHIEQFPEILIKIFDRYGRVVDEIAVNETGWDGTYNGKELPTGDYWYVIKLNGKEDEREFVGHFTLYR